MFFQMLIYHLSISSFFFFQLKIQNNKKKPKQNQENLWILYSNKSI